MTTTVDVHAHAIPREMVGAMHDAHPEYGPTLTERENGTYLSYPHGRRSGPLPEGMLEVSARLADMDTRGVDHQVISAAPPNFNYAMPANVGMDFTRLQNDALLATAAKSPARLSVFADLPLQDMAASLDELARVVDDPAVRGVEIGSNVNGRNLDDPDFEPLWGALADAGLAVLVHPDKVAGSERLTSYYLQNFVGNPTDSTIAIASLIFGGVLERHPALRFCFVHGGGFAPYQIGRWDHGWRCRPEAQTVISTPPSEYFARLFFDSLTHDRMSLQFLGERVGWDHVLLGSDYRFDMADGDPVGSVRSLGLDAALEAQVLGGNAERFLR
ncbi:amidohydrolase [Micromonospora sp. NBC_00389]|uniref:amidohydrolase family protein n=1 Tax=Micromonospora sp. NBC_00389 TaxID=2903586 RepID=UPI002E223B3C